MRSNFKKDLQREAWKFIFAKMDMQKYSTRALIEDINKFVETQTQIPFTMRNIYKMLEIVVGTTGQRMDKALSVVFEKLTMHTHENRYHVEGWKSNSHYLLNRKFIIPNMCYQDQRWYKGQDKIQGTWGSNFDLMEDVVKALCYFTGDNYDSFGSLNKHISYKYKLRHGHKIEFFNHADGYNGYMPRQAELNKEGIKSTVETYEPIYGQQFDWSYFRVRAYKKGTVHFEFKEQKTCDLFNKHIARILGYPLYESQPKPQTVHKAQNTAPKTNHTILATIKIKKAS